MLPRRPPWSSPRSLQEAPRRFPDVCNGLCVKLGLGVCSTGYANGGAGVSINGSCVAVMSGAPFRVLVVSCVRFVGMVAAYFESGASIGTCAASRVVVTGGGGHLRGGLCCRNGWRASLCFRSAECAFLLP